MNLKKIKDFLCGEEPNPNNDPREWWREQDRLRLEQDRKRSHDDIERKCRDATARSIADMKAHEDNLRQWRGC